MGLSREQAYEILELPVGVDQDSIRTSYKRLALKWHPDKHSGSGEALKKFKLVSKSYKRLTTTENTDDMSLDQMLQLFKEVFFVKNVNSYNGSGYDSSDDDDDEDDFEEEMRTSNLFPDKLKMKQDWKKARAEGDLSGKLLSPEEIRRNAEELITEEEKEKRKAEKRRAKKKRRREKKKLEKNKDEDEIQEDKKSTKVKLKETTENNTDRTRKPDKKGDNAASSSSDEAGFDPHSAFFTKVVNKKKKGGGSLSEPQIPKTKNDKGGKSDEEQEDLDPKTLRSRQLAIKGNEMAHLGHYTAAIELFSEAIKLDPNDHRFFGNRSYCYDRIQQYEKALKDAEKAITLAKTWAKGFFRQGRALAGLKMFPDAEKAFTQVLKLDKNCEDAVQELLRVRTHQIMEMGFTRQQAEAAIKIYGTVSAALDSLLAGVVAENSLSTEVYVSDDDESFTSPSQQPVYTHQPGDTKMDPKNPEGLTALWVGNVLPEVTDKKLHQLFTRFGTVKSVRCLPEKYCAFVNFSTKEAAGKAMQSLQGAEVGGQKLLIKFPDNPIVNGGGPHGTITLRKTPAASTTTTPKSTTPVPATTTHIGSAVKNPVKASGPVNGNECYFWRTTGCSYGDKCRNSHIPAHKGVDKKPWQKNQ